MQELRLCDPDRRPNEWTGLVHEGQYAVFHSDVRSDIEKKADGHFLAAGEDSTCLVFDSLSEAEAYCEAKVNEISNLRCDIYDHTGKSKRPMLTYVNKVHEKADNKRALLGWGLVALSLPCFWIEWHSHGTFLVPMIVGINLVFAGLRMVYWGKGGLEKRRSTREH
ncbi:MAG: hypothetical protein LAO20_07290 [Acidobacteriia bacterium]|nr:hypothetical protein [Terriglobia bacterium]